MPSRNREAERKRLAKWRKENPEKHDRVNREGGWKYRGIAMTVDQYNVMLKAQDYRCAICRQFPTKRLVVDHNHKTGKVRGLLCNFCNRFVVFVAENHAKLFHAALIYLGDYEPTINHTVEESGAFGVPGVERNQDSAGKVG